MIGDVILKILRRFPIIRETKIFEFYRTIIYPFLIKIISKCFKDEIDEKLIIMGAYGV